MFKFITNLFKSVDFGAKRAKIMGTFTKALADTQKLDVELKTSIDEKEAKPVLEQLAVILESHEMHELAQAIKEQK